MQEIRLSVRELVEFLLQTGSIDSRFAGFDRALEGARIHRRLQKQAGDGYNAEVSLCAVCTAESGVILQTAPEEPAPGSSMFQYRLEGRADGIFTDEDGVVTVDEIKTTTLPEADITENHRPVHWAQGQVYAAIYSAQQGLSRVRVRLTYFQVDTEAILRFSRDFLAAELQEFLQELLRRYTPWAERRAEWEALRGESLRALQFPFAEYRPGQRAMAGEIYRTFRDGAAGKGRGRVFCQAPTGIGKTMSSLFPALKAMGEGYGGRVFYLTARGTQQAAAENAVTLLRQKSGGEALALRSLTLTAKDKICPMHPRECTPEACPYANGYYDRIREALWQALFQNELTPAALSDLAEKFRVCPFELGLDLSLWCDVIIGDYNYLFDPVVSLKRFFETGGDHLFLVDEAHNLPGRARDMHSAHLSRGLFAEAKKALTGSERKGPAARVKKALGKLTVYLATQREDCAAAQNRTRFQNDKPKDFLTLLEKLCSPLQDWLDEHRSPTAPAHEKLLELYFEVRGFLRVAETYDEHFITQLHAHGRDVTVRLICLDPSVFLNDNFALGRGAALFSATLTPPAYYKDLCGCADARAVALPSPFDAANLGLFGLPVNTRYKGRDESLADVAEALFAMVNARCGNYMAFFPSYAYLGKVLEEFSQKHPEIKTLAQESGMDEAARAEFLAQFSPDSKEALLGFGVMGGVFGEGVDLAGERLIGVAVVGVGLPQVNPQQEVLRDYFEETRGSGFDYAYRFPGINKVLQAAGRVIRTPEDRGVVLLLDDRFAQPEYRRLMPAHWAHLQFCRETDALQKTLAAFWAAK